MYWFMVLVCACVHCVWTPGVYDCGVWDGHTSVGGFGQPGLSPGLSLLCVCLEFC